MRRLIPLGMLVLLAAPPAALALRAAPGDGTLSVRDGSAGLFWAQFARGVMIGKLDAGTLVVGVESERDCDALEVYGADRATTSERDVRDASVTVCVFREVRGIGSAAPIRFRLVLAQQRVWVFRGTGLSISAVGRGFGYVRGAGGEDGVYSVNGEAASSLPDDGRRFFLGTLNP